MTNSGAHGAQHIVQPHLHLEKKHKKAVNAINGKRAWGSPPQADPKESFTRM